MYWMSLQQIIWWICKFLRFKILKILNIIPQQEKVSGISCLFLNIRAYFFFIAQCFCLNCVISICEYNSNVMDIFLFINLIEYVWEDEEWRKKRFIHCLRCLWKTKYASSEFWHNDVPLSEIFRYWGMKGGCLRERWGKCPMIGIVQFHFLTFTDWTSTFDHVLFWVN